MPTIPDPVLVASEDPATGPSVAQNPWRTVIQAKDDSGVTGIETNDVNGGTPDPTAQSNIGHKVLKRSNHRYNVLEASLVYGSALTAITDAQVVALGRVSGGPWVTLVNKGGGQATTLATAALDAAAGTGFKRTSVDRSTQAWDVEGYTEFTFLSDAALIATGTKTTSYVQARLVGVQGPQGEPGPQGPQGVTGNTGAQGAPGAAGGGVPQWRRFTKTFADFSNSLTSKTLDLISPPAGSVLHALLVRTTTPLSNPELFVGFTAKLKARNDNLDVTTTLIDSFAVGENNSLTVADGYDQVASSFFTDAVVAPWKLQLEIDKVGGTSHLDSLTAGVLDIYALLSNPQGAVIP